MRGMSETVASNATSGFAFSGSSARLNTICSGVLFSSPQTSFSLLPARSGSVSIAPTTFTCLLRYIMNWVIFCPSGPKPTCTTRIAAIRFSFASSMRTSDPRPMTITIGRRNGRPCTYEKCCCSSVQHRWLSAEQPRINWHAASLPREKLPIDCVLLEHRSRITLPRQIDSQPPELAREFVGFDVALPGSLVLLEPTVLNHP